MGFLLTKNGKTNSKEVSNTDSNHLYRSMERFAWKDANKRQRKELAISAYKSTAY